MKLRDMGDELRRLHPIDSIKPLPREVYAEHLQRYTNENVVAEMVNGLRWLHDTEWWELRDGRPELQRGRRAR